MNYDSYKLRSKIQWRKKTLRNMAKRLIIQVSFILKYRTLIKFIGIETSFKSTLYANHCKVFNREARQAVGLDLSHLHILIITS